MRLGRRLPPRDARGQVLVVVVMLFVILLVFSAFVIDIGRAYLERRQDVTAADGGVLAGTSQLLNRSTPNKDVVGQNAVRVALLNMFAVPTVPSAAEIAAWNDAFAACTDPERNTTEYPAGNSYTPLLSDGRRTDCVHFNRSFTRMRVRLPNQTIETTFARVIGINQLYTHAVAEAEIEWTSIGGVMPFAVQPGGGTPSDLMCLRLDNCDTIPNHQDAKILDAPIVGRTPPLCGSMMTPGGPGTGTSDPNSDRADLRYRADQNAAVGLDHTIVKWDGIGPNRRNDDCGPFNANPLLRQVQPLPNALYATEFDGLYDNHPAAGRALIEGIVDGLAIGCANPCSPTRYFDGGPPRLQRFPAGWPTRTLDMGGVLYVIDDRPLWDFIRPGATDIPTTCARDSFFPTAWDPADPDQTGPTIGHMTICLADWLDPLQPGYPFQPLFDYDSGDPNDGLFDIELSTRAGLVPLVGNPGNQNFPPSPITGFETGFIQTLYMQPAGQDNCPVAGCAVEYDPGVATTSPGDPVNPTINITGLRTVGIAFFRILDDMLPLDARPVPGNSLPGDSELIR